MNTQQQSAWHQETLDLEELDAYVLLHLLATEPVS